MQATAGDTQHPDSAPAARRLEDARILVIDDQELNIAFLQRILENDGITKIRGLLDSRRAVETCREFRPDLVILDVRMPHVDGFEVLDQLRQADLDPHPTVLMVTADGERRVRLRALESGARDFVARPFDQAEISCRVRNLLETRLLHERLDSSNRRLEEQVRQRTVKLEDALTVLRQAEGKLLKALSRSEKTSKAKSEFFANTSHEFRTPLNAIIGFSEVLLDALPKGETRSHARHIHEAGVYLLSLIDDVLDFSKAEAGKLDIDITDVDLAHTVRDSLAMVETRAHEAGVALQVDIPADFPILRTDEKRLKQVILNLVTNAIKFTPSGGCVTVKARADAEKGAFVFVVSDTGMGMTAEEIQVALSAYGQVRNARNREQKGTGLGLPLTRGIVERLGGTLDVQSKVGVGTVVTLHFPMEIKADD